MGDQETLRKFAELELERTELSEREIEVATLWVLGCTQPETAQRMFISLNTVKSHRKAIRKKLGLGRGETIHSWMSSRHQESDHA